jgi:hypothetical protein
LLTDSAQNDGFQTVQVPGPCHLLDLENIDGSGNEFEKAQRSSLVENVAEEKYDNGKKIGVIVISFSPPIDDRLSFLPNN